MTHAPDCRCQVCRADRDHERGGLVRVIWGAVAVGGAVLLWLGLWRWHWTHLDGAAVVLGLVCCGRIGQRWRAYAESTGTPWYRTWLILLAVTLLTTPFLLHETSTGRQVLALWNELNSF